MPLIFVKDDLKIPILNNHTFTYIQVDEPSDKTP